MSGRMLPLFDFLLNNFMFLGKKSYDLSVGIQVLHPSMSLITSICEICNVFSRFIGALVAIVASFEVSTATSMFDSPVMHGRAFKCRLYCPLYKGTRVDQPIIENVIKRIKL